MSIYRFDLICPGCGKASEAYLSHRIPGPHVNCGDCLMDRVSVVEFKVVKVEEVVNADAHRVILSAAAEMRRAMFTDTEKEGE